jgi:hypothetical protein
MNRHRLIRSIKIAFSAVCGMACVLLCVLWVRSYTALESWQGEILGRAVHIQSARGRLILYGLPSVNERGYFRVPLKNIGETTELSRPVLGSRTRSKVLGKAAPLSTVHYLWLVLPMVLVTALPLALAASRTSLRFSLRTLLIATTLIAMVLGLVIWASR